MGGIGMPNQLMTVLFAAALALTSGAAVGFEMPSYGSKNFSPPGDAPSYFTNENGGLSGRGVDTASIDTGAEENAASPEVEPEHVARTKNGHHGRYASSRTSARHASGNSKAEGGSAHYAQAAKPGKASSFSQPAGAKGVAKLPPAGAAKAKMAKPAKSNLRHASAATVTA